MRPSDSVPRQLVRRSGLDGVIPETDLPPSNRSSSLVRIEEGMSLTPWLVQSGGLLLRLENTDRAVAPGSALQNPKRACPPMESPVSLRCSPFANPEGIGEGTTTE